MKKILGFFILSALIWSSCDKIESPVNAVKYRYKEEVYGPAPTFVFVDNIQKNVLLEEFTGHKCGFCPPATYLVNQLDSVLGERLVTVAVHAGTLAETKAAPYEADYNTVPGNLYWEQLQGGFNPCARIDRNGSLSTFHYLDPGNPGAWQGLIQDAKNETPTAAVQVEAEFVSEDNVINIHTASQFNEAMAGSYALTVLLIESHIISAQLDYNASPSDILDYEHKHLLRDAVTQNMGNDLASNPTAGSMITKSFTYPIKSGWQGNHMTVVAFITNKSTQEVVNATEFELQ